MFKGEMFETFTGALLTPPSIIEVTFQSDLYLYSRYLSEEFSDGIFIAHLCLPTQV